MEESKKTIEEAGGRASVITGDVRDVAQIRSLIDSAVDETGRLDIMVNNAGISYPAPIIEGDPEEWRAMLETNILAVLVGCQAAVKAMRACGAEGQIVNISSVAAQRSNSGVYGSTKHAVNSISSSLREELENDTIRVTNVMPGAIATNFARNFDQDFVDTIVKMAGMDVEVKRGDRMPPEVLDALAANMKQLLGDPNDVAKAVLYAVSQPIEVNIADIVIRPPKSMNVPH
jgi:NADP-dependent 3-hydroxy acid dehydrogenase YdfG